jgi:hypothetical protein
MTTLAFEQLKKQFEKGYTLTYTPPEVAAEQRSLEARNINSKMHPNAWAPTDDEVRLATQLRGADWGLPEAYSAFAQQESEFDQVRDFVLTCAKDGRVRQVLTFRGGVLLEHRLCHRRCQCV